MDKDANFRYVERLSKKSIKGDFANFACKEINDLQASNLQIQGFSTVSEAITEVLKSLIFRDCLLKILFSSC